MNRAIVSSATPSLRSSRSSAYDPIQPFGDRRFPPIGIVRRKKGGYRSLGNQRLGLALTICKGLKAIEDLWIKVDAELGLLHIRPARGPFYRPGRD